MKRGIETLDKKFEWFGKAAVRKYAKGRASGGQLIGVKKRLEASWKQTEWEYGLQLEIKRKTVRFITFQSQDTTISLIIPNYF